MIFDHVARSGVYSVMNCFTMESTLKKQVLQLLGIQEDCT